VKEPTEEEIREFEGLVEKAAKIHELTWCIRLGWGVYTKNLKARQCLMCSDFTLNGGACDPI